MPEFRVYILYSTTCRRFYCGSAADLSKRLALHNDTLYRGSLTTKRFAGPWHLVWSEPWDSRADAMKRERQIKSRGIKRFLESLPSR